MQVSLPLLTWVLSGEWDDQLQGPRCLDVEIDLIILTRP